MTLTTISASGRGLQPRASLQLVVGALFFASGLASLVLETVWVRMMVLVFGSTTFALSTVLTAFMGGLALGSWVAGRRAQRLADPRRALLVYGLLELSIAVYAFALPPMVERIHVVHAALWGEVHSSYYSFALLRFLLASGLLILPTAAMGATLPVLARFVCAGAPDEAVGTRVGTLYAVNTAGAVVGVILAGFVLLPRVGVRATNLAACLTDLALAAVALVLLARASSREAPPDPAATGADAADEPRQPRGPTWLPRLALVSIGISGAIAMVYQVAWNRALSLVIGSSTYAFSLILACFLVGLASGAAGYSRRQARLPDQPANLSVIHLLVAVTAFAGILFMDRLPVVLITLIRLTELAPGTVFLLKFVVTGTVILLPTFFMGMVFPAVVRIVSGAARGAARTTGDVYATNTLGSIAGSFAGGFLLVPLLGLQHSLLLMVLAGLLLSVIFGVLASRRRVRVVLVSASLLAALAVLLLVRPWNLEVMTAGVFRVARYETLLRGHKAKPVPRDEERELQARRRIPPSMVVDTGHEPPAGYEVVFHREGITTTVSLGRSVDRSVSSAACWVRQSLMVNGKPDASLSVLHPRPVHGGCTSLLRRRMGPGLYVSPSGDAETQILAGLLPVLLYPGPGGPESMLVIGWGSGITVGAVLQAPLREVVAVELEQAVVQAAHYFRPHNHMPEQDPRLRLINEDGRNYLQVSPKTYDIIVSEPSNPWIAGCGNLFTREFFQLVWRRLNRGGVYLQWIQAYEIAPVNVLSILGTLRDEFAEIFVFCPVQASSDLLIVARKDGPGVLDWSSMARQLTIPSLRSELARIRIRGPEDVLARLLAGPKQVGLRTAGVERNTDDNARIEFAAPRDLINYRKYSATAIVHRLAVPVGRLEALVQSGPPDLRERYCWGLLRTGRLREAIRLRTPDPRRLGPCHEVAARLLAPLPESVPGLAAPPGSDLGQAIARHLASPDTTNGDLGYLYALADEPFAALVYLLAAEQDGTLDSELRHVLALVFADVGHYPQAVRELASDHEH